MKVVDENLLAEVRASAYCERCGWRGAVDAHHVFSKGAGRVDVPENIVALCRRCHSLVHSGAVKRDTLLVIVSRREGTTPAKITAKVNRLRRKPKP